MMELPGVPLMEEPMMVERRKVEALLVKPLMEEPMMVMRFPWPT